MNKNKQTNAIKALSSLGGVHPFFITNSAAEKYELRKGPRTEDLITHKRFNTCDILQDIQTYGVMSPFKSCEKYLDNTSELLESFIIVCDQASTYGEMFLFLYTQEATQTYLNALAVDNAENDTKREEINENCNISEEHQALTMTDEKCFIQNQNTVREYSSVSMTETFEEVKHLASSFQRKPVEYCIDIWSNNLGRDIELEDHSDPVFEINAQLTPQSGSFEDLKYHDNCVQVGLPSCSRVTQTLTETANNGTQYEPLAIKSHIYELPTLSSVIDFLKRVLPDVEEVLQQNETVDIYSDLFHATHDDESRFPNQEKHDALKEIRKFVDLEFSKGKDITCIENHPKRSNILAAAACKQMLFDESLATTCPPQNDQSHVIIWDFSEWIHPVTLLRSPIACPHFRFHPTNPNIIIGGCVNGQVVLWDVSRNHVEVVAENMQASRKQTEGDNREVNSRDVHKPLAISCPDFSHRRFISGMHWLPEDIQMNAKGKVIPKEYLSDKTTHQFLTISGDGYALFWDIRYKEILEGKLPFVAKPKTLLSQHTRNEKNTKGAHDAAWMPFFRFKVKRFEGTGDVSLCQMETSVEGRSVASLHADGSDSNPEARTTRTQFVCASEDSELLLVDWSKRQHRDNNNSSSNNNNTEASSSSNSKPLSDNGDPSVNPADDKEFTVWMAKNDHHRPCITLARSPFFPCIVVSVSDWYFHLWETTATTTTKSAANDSAAVSVAQKPFFASPRSTDFRLTGCSWSPTRPGVLFLSKVNGAIDVWDFTHTSYEPSCTVLSTPNAISSMHFFSSSSITVVGKGRTQSNVGRPQQKKQQQQQQPAMDYYLAVGDTMGSLHVFELSKSLSTPIPKEETIAKDFYTREMEKVALEESLAQAETTDYKGSITSTDLNEPSSQLLLSEEEATDLHQFDLALQDDEYAKFVKECMAQVGLLEMQNDG